MTGECFLCGNYETVERHHIFGGPLRDKADKLGLTVYLCPWCHRLGKERPAGRPCGSMPGHQIDADSAHKSSETCRYLRKYGQRKAMLEQGWTVEDFIREFGKNYLDEDELADLYDAPEDNAGAFRVIEGAELPF